MDRSASDCKDRWRNHVAHSEVRQHGKSAPMTWNCARCSYPRSTAHQVHGRKKRQKDSGSVFSNWQSSLGCPCKIRSEMYPGKPYQSRWEMQEDQANVGSNGEPYYLRRRAFCYADHTTTSPGRTTCYPRSCLKRRRNGIRPIPSRCSEGKSESRKRLVSSRLTVPPID